MLQPVSFRVRNFRNILDSGWVDLESITAIIGPNESGKSNLCEALFRLKPYDEKTKFDLNFDWPVDQWENKKAAAPGVTAKFFIDGDDVEVALDVTRMPAPSEGAARPPKPKLKEDAEVIEIDVSRNYENKLTWEVHGIEGKYSNDALWKWFWDRVPKFVYIDDYGALGNQVELDQLANKLKNQGWAALTPAEQTIKIILDLAKIDIDDFLKKAGSAEGRTLRTFDKKSASAYLTRKFQALWEQKKVDFDIEIDGPTLNILVKDQGLHMPVPLNQRSTGFRWYVGFAWRFTHATSGDFKGTVLLLEEPGIHLHPAAQADLLRLFETLSETNQIIYTTHLPSLVDPGYPERIRIAELAGNHTKVTKGLVTRSRAPMMVIEASLGLSPQMSNVLGSRKTLIVEGPDDATVLNKLSRVMAASGKPCLAEDVYIWPAQGAAKTPMFAGFIIGHGWPGGALLDGDDEGQNAAKKIRELYKNVDEKKFFVGTIADALELRDRPLTIEDVLGVEFYTEVVAAAYKIQIEANDVDSDWTKPLPSRFDALLESRGHGDLDKGRVMSVLLKRFAGWKSSKDLPVPIAENAEKLFSYLAKRL